MFLELNKIGIEGHEFDHVLALPDLEGSAGEKISVTRAHLAGEANKGEAGFDLEAHLEASVALACGRCLTPFEVEIRRDFFLTLVVPSPSGEPAKEFDEEEEVTQFSCPEGRADLFQMVAEQVYLSLPLKPLCREGCKGLCPVCGADRNVAACGCRSEAWDPRLAPLLQFKNRRTT